MKSTLLIFGVGLLFFACESKNDYNHLEKENHFLKLKVDSLENWINHAFDPIIIENNKNKVLYAGDTANFVVGLLMNDERIIDSIEISLFRIKNSNVEEFVQKSIAAPAQSNNKNNYGVEYFSLPNLSQGNYLYKGIIMVQGKKIPIEHYFKVEEVVRR